MGILGEIRGTGLPLYLESRGAITIAIAEIDLCEMTQ
jgi:hypothetical protein